MKALTKTNLANIGSMITIKDSNTCLGYLMFFDGHGTYDATYGQVPVTKEEADIHNKLLDKAMLDGMNLAKVGQSMPIPVYFNEKDKRITTFIGTVIQGNITKTSGQVTLERRNGNNLQVWKGRLHKDDDCVSLKLCGIN